MPPCARRSNGYRATRPISKRWPGRNTACSRKMKPSTNSSRPGKRNKSRVPPARPKGNRTGFHAYAHEKPDFEEQPESAPEGIDDPPWFMRKLAAEMVFFTLTLAHCGQRTISGEVGRDQLLEVGSCSRCRHIRKLAWKVLLVIELPAFLSTGEKYYYPYILNTEFKPCQQEKSKKLCL